MQDVLKQREQLSALADGALEGAELAQALNAARDEEALATWATYHLIGDVMRSTDLARPGDSDLLRKLRVQLAQEPVRPVRAVSEVQIPVVGPSTLPAPSGAVALPEREAANAAVWRWRMVAGLASVAALALGSWTLLGGVGGAEPVLGGGAVMASGTPAQPATPVASVAPRPAGTSPQMLRDPRLDELVAAQKQLGNPPVTLQMPADFLRNATFEQRRSR